MNDKDEKIAYEILKKLYEEFKKDTDRGLSGQELYNKMDDYNKKDIIYVAKRIDGNLVEILKALGAEIPNIHIKMKGVEKLYEKEYDTFLQGNERYQILEYMYNQDRENTGISYISKNSIKEELDTDEDKIDMNIKYLLEKSFIEGMAANRTHLSITEKGRQGYEAYINNGVEIPRTSTYRNLRQISIGPNEEQKGENLFRDFVELAQNEIIIIDRYARKGLYDLLKYVPSSVQVRVFTTDRVMNGDYKKYKKDIEPIINEVKDIEIRYLKDKNWKFHARYVIRDFEKGWTWDHSFHDTGKKHHTPSELKPTNLEKIINRFETAWKNANIVI